MSILDLKQAIPLRSFGIDVKKYNRFIKRVAVSLGVLTFIVTYVLGAASFGVFPWIIFGWFPSGLGAWITSNLVYHTLKLVGEHEHKPAF